MLRSAKTFDLLLYLFTFERLTTSSSCGTGGGGMGGGLAAAAADRSTLRTPASRYADTLMEMDEDELCS